MAEQGDMSGEHGQNVEEAGTKQPSLRQQRVLDKYYEMPNAAAVARDLDMSERQVRRIVRKRRVARTSADGGIETTGRSRSGPSRDVPRSPIGRTGRSSRTSMRSTPCWRAGRRRSVCGPSRCGRTSSIHVTMLSAPRSKLEDALMSKELEISEELRHVRFEDLIPGNGEESDR